MVELRRDLARIAREAVDVSEELFNVGQADRPDVLEVAIEAERAEIELTRAENDLARVWQELAAVIGEPDLPYTPLAGDLEAELPAVDEAAVRARILKESPELRIARARARARPRPRWPARRADRMPNFFVRGGAGYNFDGTEAGRTSGRSSVSSSASRCRSSIATTATSSRPRRSSASRERSCAGRSCRLRSRLADRAAQLSGRAADGRALPAAVLARRSRATSSISRALREMAAAYPQVLIAQRTLAQVRAEYVRALVEVRHAAVLLKGFLLHRRPRRARRRSPASRPSPSTPCRSR